MRSTLQVMAAQHTHAADASSDHVRRAAIVEFDEPRMNNEATSKILLCNSFSVASLRCLTVSQQLQPFCAYE